MSPIDDELRAALHGRAQVLTPSPDPLSGIEERARRIRRQRAGAAIAGSALAVAVIAVAVPAVQSAVSPTQDVPTVATSHPPTAGPTPEQHTTDTATYALDPQDPWPYRGVPLEQLGTGTVDTIQREYAARHGAASVQLSPLFGQVDEPSQLTELVFLAEVMAADGVTQYFWGVARTSEAGPEFVWDEPLSEPSLALAAALPGDDGVQRLLVVAAPSVGGAVYAADGSSYAPMTDLEAGVLVTAISPGDRDDRFRVLDGDGDLDAPVVEAQAPDGQDADGP